jgi:uncharacterized protein (TIGR00730 family)
MKSPNDFTDTSALIDAWRMIKAHSDAGFAIEPDAYRFAFADPEFLLRRETRGIRFQLEMLKPDLVQQMLHIEDTIVVFGSARFLSHDQSVKNLQLAEATKDARIIKKAQKDLSNAEYYEQARKFGHLVAQNCNKLPIDKRIYICTGGGPGVMEAANRGASEAGALTLGLNIALPHEQCANPYVSPELSFKFHYFAARKMHFMMRAKALVSFPGGFGTLDELFEVLTLVQTKKTHPVPIVLFGKNYWEKLINFDFLVEEGVISEEDLQLFHYTDDHQEAWKIIQDFYNSPLCSVTP